MPPDHLRNFGFLMKDVSRLSSKNFERLAVGLKLTMSQCKVLGYLQRNEGISQTRLAELTDTDPMTLLRIVDRMERDSWIERRADPADRRAHRLFLLPAATPVLEEVWRISDRSRAEAMKGLSTAAREQLMNLMSHIHANLLALLPADESTNNAAAASGVAPAPTSSSSKAARKPLSRKVPTPSARNKA
jgi:MarR family transcriptional regulator for hemolysin